MTRVNADLMEEIQKRAFQKCMDLTNELVDSQLGVGDHQLNRAERIARFVDYAERGVLDALKGIGAPVYQKLVNEYIRDIGNSPYITQQPESE